MPTLDQLTTEVAGWLDRKDVIVLSLIPGWVQMCETDIGEFLRARCMIHRATQPIDAPFITLPSDFATMESLRDATTRKLLTLEDAFTGPDQAPSAPYPGPARVTGYRLVGNCLEFLPAPVIPDPPDPIWQPQLVEMAWYQRPTPLQDPQDTNPVLENHYAIYLFGTCKYGAMFELDDDRAAQMESAFNNAVFAANLWKDAQQYSGAPLRAVVRGF